LIYSTLIGLVFLVSTEWVLVIDAEHLSTKSDLLELARAETGLELLDSTTSESRLVSVGPGCDAANYRFFLTWDGEALTAKPDDEAVELLCRKATRNQPWRCKVEIKRRSDLLDLELTESICCHRT
jgi:hypothetical protein